MNIVFQFGEWIGTAAFAVSGAMVAVDKKTDIFGVILLAVITALGGGTLRDMLLGQLPPRMFSNFQYVLLATLCAVAVFLLASIFKERFVEKEHVIEQINNVFDAIGLGVFAVSGALIGMEAGYGDNVFLLAFLGMTTAIGGGMIRDMMIQEIPFVLKKRIYAVAAIAGALTFIMTTRAGIPSAFAYGAGCAVTTTLRILATVFRWNLPRAM